MLFIWNDFFWNSVTIKKVQAYLFIATYLFVHFLLGVLFITFYCFCMSLFLVCTVFFISFCCMCTLLQLLS